MVLELFLGLAVIGLLSGIWSRLGRIEARLDALQSRLGGGEPPPQ